MVCACESTAVYNKYSTKYNAQKYSATPNSHVQWSVIERSPQMTKQSTNRYTVYYTPTEVTRKLQKISPPKIRHTM